MQFQPVTKLSTTGIIRVNSFRMTVAEITFMFHSSFSILQVLQSRSNNSLHSQIFILVTKEIFKRLVTVFQSEGCHFMQFKQQKKNHRTRSFLQIQSISLIKKDITQSMIPLILPVPESQKAFFLRYYSSFLNIFFSDSTAWLFVKLYSPIHSKELHPRLDSKIVINICLLLPPSSILMLHFRSF